MDHMPGFYWALWCEDKRSMQATRVRNVASDLDAGCSPFGLLMQNQFKDLIDKYEDYRAQFIRFSEMTVAQVDEWCRQDLIDRGAIEE